MDYEIVIPVLISFAISAILGPIVIPFLKRLKVGQTERKELESHLKKNGTPTMGGGLWAPDINGKYYHYLSVLCQRLSENYPNPFYDRRIRCDRFSG